MSIERAFCTLSLGTARAHQRIAIASRHFLRFQARVMTHRHSAEREKSQQDRKIMTRDQAAAKWKCSPGTIDKYSS